MNLVSDKHPLLSLLSILFTVIIGFVVIGPLVGVGITAIFYEGSLLNDILDPSPEMFPYVLAVQGIASFVGLIVFPWLHLAVLERKTMQRFFPPEPRFLLIFLILALLGFNFIISISPLIEWNANFSFPESLKGFEEWARRQEDRASDVIKVATAFQSERDLLFGIFVIALIPAVGEELVFRGMIQNEFRRAVHNVHAAIWISAFLFSAIHMQFFGFVPRLLLGALFGYLYYWSGNLLIPMFSHFFNNALSVVALYLNKKEIITTNIEEAEAAPWYTVLFCVLISIGLLYYFRTFYSTQKQNPAA